MAAAAAAASSVFGSAVCVAISDVVGLDLDLGAFFRVARARGREVGVPAAGLMRRRSAAAALSFRARVCITPVDLRGAMARLVFGGVFTVLAPVQEP